MLTNLSCVLMRQGLHDLSCLAAWSLLGIALIAHYDDARLASELRRHEPRYSLASGS
jgi:hypothetical protein